MKRISAVITLVLFLFVVSSCTNNQIRKVESSSEVYIRKIENLNDDFIMGMDVSSVIALENSGVTYYDYEGNEADLFSVLAQSGINYIRVRVWNDPYDENGNGYGGGNCDINTAVEIGKRANKYGMKLLVDFHYSDFWADPGKQMVPKAWKDLSIEDKSIALYEYTRDCLKKLKDAKVKVGMVQIGNETNGAMCGEKVWMNIIYQLMASGSKAVREVYPDALVAVHFANPEKEGAYADYAKKLNYYDLDYDVFATSYYPYWHGSLDNLTGVLNNIADTYNKKVMVIETSYAYTAKDSDFSPNTISDDSTVTKNYPYTVQGQTNCILDIIDTVNNRIHNGIGICYWEGAWISVGSESYEKNQELWEKYGSGWASSYAGSYDPDDAGKYYGGSAVDNQAFFDSDGHPLESLKLFELCKTGNEIPLKADAIEDTNVSIDINEDIILPDKVYALMNDGSRQEIEVIWDDFDEETLKNKGIGKYVINGTADSLEAKCYLSLIEYNYLMNHSFEEDPNGTFIPSSWKVNKIADSDELYVETKKTDSLSGDNHYHFWSKANNSIEFELEQEVKDLNAGNYKFSINIMGGDAGNSDIYAYVKINDEIIEKDPMKITSYNNWDEGYIEKFTYDGTSKLCVGIYVKCDGAGAWGKIDEALLNSVGE
ncbi:MAG: glycosyl hydrolase 53 family protein [Erysipelotrichaceae bacterium]|nr:glycosyl hydrolase 53 family protein [Erysipelotrichaceae bacterium]